MEVKKLFAIIALGLVFAGAVAVSNSNLVITDVDFDSTLAPGDILDLELAIENTAANDNLENLAVKAYVYFAGDEVAKIKLDLDRTLRHSREIEDLHVRVPLPVDLPEDVYTVYIEVRGDWEYASGSAETTFEDTFEIEQSSYGLAVTDVKVSSAEVLAGEPLDVAVTLLNNGQKEASDVKLRVEIPEINVAETVTLLSPLATDQERTQYVALEVPAGVKSGVYTLKATAYTASSSAVYEEDLVVSATAAQPAQGTVPSATQKVTKSLTVGKGAVISTKLTNNAAVTKTYELMLGGTRDWTTSARVDPSTVTLAPGEQATANVYVQPSEAGKHTATVFIRENGNTISFVNLDVSVASGALPAVSDSAAWVFAVVVIVLAAGIAIWQYSARDKQKKGKLSVYY